MTTWRGVAFATLAAFLFALNGSVSKTVLESGLSSQRLVELRSAGAAACFLLAVLLTRPATLKARPREAAFLLTAGVVGIGLVQFFYFVAIGRLPVGIALLLEYLAPVLVVVWVRFVRRESVRSRIWAALALSVVGLVVVAEAWQGLSLDGLGVLAGLGAAAALAAYYSAASAGSAGATRSASRPGRSPPRPCSGRPCSRGGPSRGRTCCGPLRCRARCRTPPSPPTCWWSG